MGLSQVALANATGVSLPTVQNLEAGKGNPTFEPLEPLLRALQLEVKIAPIAVDWDALAWLGVPLIQQGKEGARMNFQPSGRLLFDHLSRAALALFESRESLGSEDERRLQAVQALLVALNHHFPQLYERECSGKPAISRIYPTELTGRLIKLRRIALARIAEYL
jgi:transcriptional regulator with XRE-family HTH domain